MLPAPRTRSLPVMSAQAGGYPVVWRERAGLASGKLVLGPDGVRLEGTIAGRLARRRIAYRRLVGVRIGREPEERINGRPTIVLEQHGVRPLLVEPLGAGLLSELAELLAELGTAWSERLEQVAVVVPLKEGALERARTLTAQGPPFDLAEAKLDRHYVFLSEREAVFVFVGPQVGETVRRLLGDPATWGAGAGWAPLIAGRPRLAELGFAWPAGAIPSP